PLNENGANIISAHNNRLKIVAPDQFSAAGQLSTQKIKMGIYQWPLYHSQLELKGLFSEAQVKASLEDIKSQAYFSSVGQPYLAVYIKDMRGLSQQVEATIQGKKQLLQAGAKLGKLKSGLHSLPLNPGQVAFSMKLGLKGLENLALLPLGQDNQLSIGGDWPDPQFAGAILPDQRSVNEQGFSAQWQTAHYSLNSYANFEECTIDSHCDLSSSQIEINLIDAVDKYLQTERALKYAFLFIGLSFMVFFIYEHLKASPIHPIQYGFVGLAIAVFYLLLLALSEHIDFLLAYFIAACASCGLLAVYVHSVFKHPGVAAGFTGLLALLQGFLYIILQAEDFALLMGAGLVFVLLACLMLGTRHINWYQIDQLNGDKKQVQKQADT
ncbi:MAG: cell envelope integrity protein CreD, partial [Cellvibrionaceae bacterium]|nr:cell envelope integrity protein CreD [Cellvibrionaceae bacterium]